VIDFGDLPVFDATTYPCIVVAVDATPKTNATKVLAVESMTILTQLHEAVEQFSWRMPQQDLGSKGWALVEPEVISLMRKLRTKGKPFHQHVGGRFFRGVTTGLNEAFVIDAMTRARILQEDPKSAELIYPWIRGRDVKRWKIDDAGELYLVFTRRGINISQYPAIERHLRRFQDKLTPGLSGGRKPGKYAWYEIQDSTAYFEIFREPKIVWPDIAKRCEFALDVDSRFPDATLFTVPGDQYLLAVLNSPVTEWFILHTSSSIQQGYLRFKEVYLAGLPIPEATSHQRDDLQRRVSRLLDLNGQGPEARRLEGEVNQLVYRLFDLTAEEIGLIESQLVGAKMTPATER
jgi:hypothetical protein